MVDSILAAFQMSINAETLLIVSSELFTEPSSARCRGSAPS